MSRPSLRQRLADDRGSILLLIIGMTVLCLALIVATLDATSLYLERKRLFTVADGAALVAAQAFDLSAGLDPLTHLPRLSDTSVTRASSEYLTNLSAPAKRDFSLEAAITDDAKTATVVMRGVWHPPVISIFMPAGLPLEVSSSARVFY